MSSKRYLSQEEVALANLTQSLQDSLGRTMFAAGVFNGTAGGFSLIDSFGLDATTPLTRTSAGLYQVTLAAAQPDNEYLVMCDAIPYTNLQPAPWHLKLRGDGSTGYLNKTTTAFQLIYGGTSLTDTARGWFACYRI